MVYLDNAASTRMTPKVLEILTEHLKDNFGNPSSMHAAGRKARIAIEEARRIMSQSLNCSLGEIFFTSGGTEANNTILERSVTDLGVQRIITSKVEHPCVLEKLHSISPSTLQLEYVQIDDEGRANLEDLERLLQEGPKTLVSLMHANNEIGSLNDIAQIAILCKNHDALFHSDTTQTVGYYAIDLQEIHVDFISGSAHKFHGPKGIGFMFIRDDHQIKPLLYGGHQERNMRAGTENTPYIKAMAVALEECLSGLDEMESYIAGLRAYAVEEIKKHCPNIEVLNGDGKDSHYKILNIALPLTERSSLALMNLDIAGICVSAGSACSSGAEKGSHVFDELFPGKDLKLIRLSFSKFNSREDIDQAVSALKKILV